MDDKDMYEQLTMEELFQEEIDYLQAAIDELDDEGLTEENQTKILKYRIVQENRYHIKETLLMYIAAV